MSEMTSEEAWALIEKNKNLLYWYADKKHRQKKYSHEFIKDTAHNIMIIVHDQLMRGYLAEGRGTLGTIVSFASRRGSALTYKELGTTISVPIIHIERRRRVLDCLENNKEYCLDAGNGYNQVMPRETLLMLANAMYPASYINLYDKATGSEARHVELLELNNSLAITEQEMCFDHLAKRAVEMFKEWYGRKDAALFFHVYAFARYFGIEEYIIKHWPELFNREDFGLEILDEDGTADVERSTVVNPALRDIGEEMGLCRERVRQLVANCVEYLSQKLA